MPFRNQNRILNNFTDTTKGATRGATLVELLVTISVTGILLLAASSIVKMNSDVAQNSRRDSNAKALTSRIVERLRYPDVCRATLFGAAGEIDLDTLNPADINNTLDMTLNLPGINSGPAMDRATLAAGDIILPYGLRVLQLQLRRPVDITVAPPNNCTTGPFVGCPADGSRTIMAVLRVQVEKIGSTGVLGEGQAMAPRDVALLSLGVTPGNMINTCRVDQVRSLADLCNDWDCDFAAATQTCTCPPKTPTACQPFEVATGIIDGVYQCRKLAGECPAGTVVTAFNIESVRCSPPSVWIPTLGAPPVQQDCMVSVGQEWIVGGNACLSDATVIIPNTETRAVNDTDMALPSPATGVSQWLCTAGVPSLVAGATCAVGGPGPGPGPGPCVANGLSPPTVPICRVDTLSPTVGDTYATAECCSGFAQIDSCIGGAAVPQAPEAGTAICVAAPPPLGCWFFLGQATHFNLAPPIPFDNCPVVAPVAGKACAPDPVLDAAVDSNQCKSLAWSTPGVSDTYDIFRCNTCP